MVPIALLEACAAREAKGRVFLYAWLWHYAGERDTAFPSIPRLALECRMKKDDIRSGLAWLAAEGWIQRIDRPGHTTLFHVRTERPTPVRKRKAAATPPPTGGYPQRGKGQASPLPLKGDTPVGGYPQGGKGQDLPLPPQGEGTPPPVGAPNKKHLTRTNPIQEVEPPLPPVPLRSTGGSPQVEETAAAVISRTADNSPAQEISCEIVLAPVKAPAAPSKKKARVPAAQTPLPPDQPVLPAQEEEALAAWWARRCELHPRADRLRFGPLNHNAVRRATEQGVLLAYLQKAAEAGWQSLGHAGSREVIERLARDLVADTLGSTGHHGNGMLRFGEQPAGYSSPFQRKLAAMELLFTPEDGGPSDDHTAEPRPCA